MKVEDAFRKILDRITIVLKDDGYVPNQGAIEIAFKKAILSYTGIMLKKDTVDTDEDMQILLRKLGIICHH